MGSSPDLRKLGLCSDPRGGVLGRTQAAWGLGMWQDLKGLGVEPCLDLKELRGGWVCVRVWTQKGSGVWIYGRTQRGWGLGVGSIRALTQEGLGVCARAPTQGDWVCV